MKLEIHVHLADLPALMAMGLRILQQLERMETKMSEMDDDIAALQASVTAENTVIESAVALINGFGAQLKAAVDAALAAGATAAQLTAVTDLRTAIDAKRDEIAAAVAANSAPEPAPAP